jgi:2-polyprenyl-3-methyl-5-hydroxy-6-metoxy-1,4-benzoquinol methylase
LESAKSRAYKGLDLDSFQIAHERLLSCCTGTAIAAASFPSNLTAFDVPTTPKGSSMPGNPSETVIDLYRRHAAQWDAARRSSGWNDRVWIDAFANELARGSRVLDLGCSGGEPVARLLAERGMHVTGVDSSREMIALARGRMPRQEWIVADMRRLALDRHFDGILAWDSYFHLAHEAQRAMFAMFDAHAEDDAVLMFNTGPEHGESTSTFTFKDEHLYHASLAPAEYRALLDRSGFEVICHVANDARSGGRTAWLCQRKRPR